MNGCFLGPPTESETDRDFYINIYNTTWTDLFCWL